jgi:hypothetical protein
LFHVKGLSRGRSDGAEPDRAEDDVTDRRADDGRRRLGDQNRLAEGQQISFPSSFCFLINEDGIAFAHPLINRAARGPNWVARTRFSGTSRASPYADTGQSISAIE